ncbi:MAG: hypothetical protein JW937_04485 [Candidatus Omnitrophica bacterium]|nr:hypothetical protein [Candidatus Omnitrophota bacterium]
MLKTEDMEADPSTDRYQKHYSFWRLWHKDMIQTLQDSMNSRGSFQGKKFSRAMEGALLELRQMQRFLPEESKSVLDQELDELQKTGMRVLDQQGRDRMRSDAEQRLNTQMRRIQRDFSFDEVSSVLLEPSS